MNVLKWRVYLEMSQIAFTCLLGIILVIQPYAVAGSGNARDLQHEQCGNQITSDRIVGGNITNIDEYPWLAIIKYRFRTGLEQWACGGTLIGRRSILTAAHCVEEDSVPPQRELLFVRLGEHDVSKETDCSPQGDDCADPPLDFQVTKVIIHPQRNAIRRIHDIALLILNGEPPYTDFIRPICLPEPSTGPAPRKNIFVAGWGSTTLNSDALQLSTVKLYARLSHIVHSTCDRYYSSYRFTENDIICAGGTNGVNACRGDSGGPLMESQLIRNVRWYVIGVVQLGPKICAIANRTTAPTVFVRVATYKDWILTNLQ